MKEEIWNYVVNKSLLNNTEYVLYFLSVFSQSTSNFERVPRGVICFTFTLQFNSPQTISVAFRL